MRRQSWGRERASTVEGTCGGSRRGEGVESRRAVEGENSKSPTCSGGGGGGERKGFGKRRGGPGRGRAS